jgi:signal transduction histidine kinase
MANALRLAPAGSPVVVGAGATPGWRWFGVRDFGPGIAVADQPFVFARGWHGGDAVDGAGSGIGLALVRQIAEAQGGTVRLSSVPRGGSSFLIWLPAGDGHAAAPLGPDLAVDPLWFPASLAAPTHGPGPLGGERPTSPPMPFPAQA